jgi:hypothetical protein
MKHFIKRFLFTFIVSVTLRGLGELIIDPDSYDIKYIIYWSLGFSIKSTIENWFNF